MNEVNVQRDIIISLLSRSSDPMPISDIWRGLRNRGFEIGYNEFEDWLLDQVDLIQLSVQGGVLLRPDVEISHVRRTQIVPDLYEQNGEVDATTRLHRLISYYLDCLKEEGKSIAAYREQQNSSFVVLGQELFASRKTFASIRTIEAGDFVKNVSGGKRSAFYGYPLLMQWIETGDGEFADYKVIPIFIARLELQEEPERCIFHLAANSPRLNPLIMMFSRWKDRSFIRTKLDADQEFYSSFEERVSMVASVLQNLDVHEELDPGTILRASDLSIIESHRGGLYNRCGIFLGGANPYNVGLIKDLEEMLDKSGSHFEKTALSSLIRSATENEKDVLKSSEPIRVFSPYGEGDILNAAQEAAIKLAFSHKISVVTGPPGTGKSQVVLAIIATAILLEKTVLFASRNNKALEIVQERLKRICPDNHTLIRVGGDFDKTCYELLERMGNLPLKEDVMPFRKQMLSIGLHLAELDKLEKLIDETAITLGKANLAEERFEILKQKFLPGRFDAYDSVKEFDSNALLAVANRYEKLLSRIASWPSFLAKLAIRCQNRAGKKEIELLRSVLQKAHIELETIWPKDRDELRNSFKSLFPLIELIRAAAEMSTAAEKLGDASELDNIFKRIVEHKQAMAKKVPALLLAKVRENASGHGLLEKTQDAVLQYRDTMPQLRGTRLNDEQRRIRLDSLGHIFPDMLNRLPAWAVTNLSISHRIPLEPGVFDLAIIDEASQCDIPSCLPLLYRAKHVTVIGDPLQLPQITQISLSVEDQLLRQKRLDGPENDHLRYSEKSMYDAARRVTPRSGYQFLSSHYRCHPDIIRFANSSHWYEDRLNVFTDVGRLKRPKFWEKGIEWVQISSKMKLDSPKGYYLPEEVQSAVDIIQDLLETRKYEGTLGVVCPLRGMVNLIRDKVEKTVHARLLQAAEFEAQTAHGFQGDERDVIIYVMAIHPNMPRGARWFIAENSNLFNVALSRARAAFVVVGDKQAARDFTFENRTVDYLKDFVNYAETLGDDESVAMGEPTFKPEQLWEERFYYNALKPANIPVYSQYPLGPYKLDFALLRQNRQRKLDIEIDGETYHKDTAGRRLRQDIDRDIYVKAQDGRSWDIMRFWVYELREDMELCLKKIQQWMNSAT